MFSGTCNRQSPVQCSQRSLHSCDKSVSCIHKGRPLCVREKGDGKGDNEDRSSETPPPLAPSFSAQADLGAPTLQAKARNARLTHTAPPRSVPDVQEPRSHATTPPRCGHTSTVSPGSSHVGQEPSAVGSSPSRSLQSPSWDQACWGGDGCRGYLSSLATQTFANPLHFGHVPWVLSLRGRGHAPLAELPCS